MEKTKGIVMFQLAWGCTLELERRRNPNRTVTGYEAAMCAICIQADIGLGIAGLVLLLG